MFNEITALLTDAERLQEEVTRFLSNERDETAIPKLESRLTDVRSRQERLAQLLLDGDLPEDVLRPRARLLQAERSRLEAEIAELRRSASSRVRVEDAMASLPEFSARVASWIASAEGNDLGVLLRGLDLKVRASRDRAIIEASVPVPKFDHDPDLVTIEQTSG